MDIALILVSGTVVLAGLVLLGALLFAILINRTLCHDEHSEGDDEENERL